MDAWSLRSSPVSLVRPVRIDSSGQDGPTRGQAGGPRWRWVAPSLYVPASADRNIPEQRIVEEAARLPASGAVTGWAALRMHGAGYFDGVGADGKALPVPLVVPPGVALRRSPGTVIHRERLEPDERSRTHGIAVTSPERATFDCARRAADLRAAVVVIDMVLASGLLSLAGFRRHVDQKDGWPGVARVRGALELTDPRSMSPKETELRLIWSIDGRLPRPRCNWPIADSDGGPIGRPDLLSEELAVVGEFDGAHHRSRDRHRDDLRRDDRFRAVGLEPFRVVGADLSDIPLVLNRIRSAIDRSATSGTPRTWLAQTNPKPVR